MNENTHFLNMIPMMDPTKIVTSKDDIGHLFLEDHTTAADCVPMDYDEEWPEASELTTEELHLGEEFLDSTLTINESPYSIPDMTCNNGQVHENDVHLPTQNYQQIKASAYKATDFFTDFMFGNVDTLSTMQGKDTNYTRKRKLTTHTGLGPLEQKRKKYEKKPKSPKPNTAKSKNKKKQQDKKGGKLGRPKKIDVNVPNLKITALLQADFTSPNVLKQRQTSKFRGVSCCGKDRKWQARIRESNRVRYLGRFQTEVEAALVYDEASRQCKGERAPTNFISMDAITMEKLKTAFAATGGIPEDMKCLIAVRRKGRKKKSKKANDVPVSSTPQNIKKGMKVSKPQSASPKVTKKSKKSIAPLNPRPLISNHASKFWAGTASSKLMKNSQQIACV